MKGYRMRELRQMAKLRQVEVAAELGLHNVTVCNWEKRDKDIPRTAEVAFMALVNDVERVHFIKSTRRARHRKNQKKVVES